VSSNEISVLSLAHARGLHGPLRAWSLAVTFLGDCIEPRGGSVGMATITDLLAVYGVDNGVVRTSMSRLASEGWVAREKVGRNSFYALTPLALAETHEAARRIYAPEHPSAPCGWRIYAAGQGGAEERRRERLDLERHGAGALDKNVLILPEATSAASPPSMTVLSTAPLPDEAARKLVKEAFDLAGIEREYSEFVASYAPLAGDLGAVRRIGDFDALALRVLLVHRFRRIALRDPGIPSRYLAPRWPGIVARETARASWRALFAPSERWLDANARSPRGELPPRQRSAPGF
jgi:phenylacetic acid degradation operon negative regulatory protein